MDAKEEQNRIYKGLESYLNKSINYTNKLEDLIGKSYQYNLQNSIKEMNNYITMEETLCEYFHRTKKSSWQKFEQLEEYFLAAQQDLKDYTIRPFLIYRVYRPIIRKNMPEKQKDYLGIFLSALIQTSYSQGHNRFTFGEINTNFFGAMLRGKENEPINLQAAAINGNGALMFTSQAILKVSTLNGNNSLYVAQHCQLDTQNLSGNDALKGATYCDIILEDYAGKNFGRCMKNCTITSNEKTLKKIKSQAESVENNWFITTPTKENPKQECILPEGSHLHL